MAGQTATHTMVIAQTYVGGKNVGHNWFIVQLRDTVTGELMPNIQAGDIGHKVGRPGLDNGYVCGSKCLKLFSLTVVILDGSSFHMFAFHVIECCLVLSILIQTLALILLHHHLPSCTPH